MRLCLVTILAGVVVALAGCGLAVAEHSQANQPGTAPFLPEHLKMLQGKVPPKQDACHPQKVADVLLAPCDEPDHITPEPDQLANKENK